MTTYSECIIKVAKVISLKNNLSVVTGMLVDSPDANCSDQCATPKYTPFVTLVSQSDFNKYKLGHDTSSFEDFNPTVRVKNGQSVYLQVTPGKEFSVASADLWQNSSEAKAAQQILSSVTLYK
ncbi:MAG: hypothetical protein JWM81_335 [Candidatus Saccharibacteria bacterium]|nr:hypothetical protein [Candidatus Saccharibacteria bacterium]